MVALDVWVAATVASGTGPAPGLSLELPLRVARDGVTAVLPPGASTTAFTTGLIALVIVEVATVIGVLVVLTRAARRGTRAARCCADTTSAT